MYRKGYGIIETLAPLHVGATAGEESGNLNLIFRDQFTQTGIIPGSSIRGRLRAEMRQRGDNENAWYGHEAILGKTDSTSESLVKFEYASIVWLPVFCPGQPVVWVSCPKLLKRYRRITGNGADAPEPYTGSKALIARDLAGKKVLFFNLGFLTILETKDLTPWFPDGVELPAVVVSDNDIGMIHDMALYRQTRVVLDKDMKKVSKYGGFFNTEALPEGTYLAFPVGVRIERDQKNWYPFESERMKGEVYLGGLESIGFGHCQIQLNMQGVSE